MRRASILLMSWDPDADAIRLPAAVRLPVELEPPPGFAVDDPATWPRVEGRLEYVAGRLLYMPPCGAEQQGVAASVVGVLIGWADEHDGFFVGGNEAGMLFGREARGADGAVWRRADLGVIDRRYVRVPPLLVAEVEGRAEGEAELRTKARWYFAHGVGVVWLVLPSSREVVVLRPGSESRHGMGDRLPDDAALPGLAPAVDRFFRQLG